jgi:hypothetical protein
MSNTTADPMIEAKIRTLQSYLGELRSAGRGPGNPVYDQKAAQLATLQARRTAECAAR